MGQDQSTVLNDENIDSAQARVRPRDKRVTTRQVKTVKRSDPDQFMLHANVTDHIKPIRETEHGTKDELDSYEGILDLAAKLKGDGKKKAEELDLRVMSLPATQKELSGSESESDLDEDRGVYHREVSTEIEPTSVFRETAHPVAIEGECAVGCVLKFRDDSPFRFEFPVYKIEWVESLSVGDSNTFSVKPLAAGAADTCLKIESDLLGKLICVKASRNVEDQLARTKFGDVEGGLYDPHIAGARTASTKPPPQYVTVASTCIAGPVLLAEAAAAVILKALARGGFSCAVKMRDVLDSADRAVPLERDPVKASKAKNKIPATLLVDGSMLELRYLQQHVMVDKDGFIRTNVTKGRLEEKEKTDFLKIIRGLGLVSLRPSKGPETIVMALEFQPHGHKRGGTQQNIRFDVDPAVGRDIALQTCIAFQATRLARIPLSKCETWYNEGNVDAVRQVVQEFLVAQTGVATEEVPAFEKMATTPWAVLNYRP